eukprot:g73252.t1
MHKICLAKILHAQLGAGLNQRTHGKSSGFRIKKKLRPILRCKNLCCCKAGILPLLSGFLSDFACSSASFGAFIALCLQHVFFSYLFVYRICVRTCIHNSKNFAESLLSQPFSKVSASKLAAGRNEKRIPIDLYSFTWCWTACLKLRSSDILFALSMQRMYCRFASSSRAVQCATAKSPSISSIQRPLTGLQGPRMPVIYCFDNNHRPLRDQFVASLDCQGHNPCFELRETFVQDFGAHPTRAAGGFRVQAFKLELVLRTLDALLEKLKSPPVPGQSAGSPLAQYFVFSDVDIQCLGCPRRLYGALGTAINTFAGGTSLPDVLFQREFETAGVNVGFILIRAAPAVRQLFQAVHEEVCRHHRMDQKVMNRVLLKSGAQHLRAGRLPSTFWASSNCGNVAGQQPPQPLQPARAQPSLPQLADLVLHHANFIKSSELTVSSDPQPKLRQLQLVRTMHDLQRSDKGQKVLQEEAWRSFCQSLAADPTLHRYAEQHFPAADHPRYKRLKIGIVAKSSPDASPKRLESELEEMSENIDSDSQSTLFLVLTLKKYSFPLVESIL